ncbi:MAG: hypothetical protein DRP90_03360, partial [Planctomycetota bacterium]
MRPAALALFLLALAAALSVRPLSAERAASPEVVTARQREVKREFDELVKKLERMSLKLKEEDPSRAEMCREALKRITASALDSLLDEMAALAREGRYGLALKRSEDVLKALQELLDVLEGAGDIDERLARLEGFITRLESLLERQKELRRRTEDEKELAPLAEPQGKLAIEARRLGSEMEDAAFPDSGSKVKLAADEMDGASAALKDSRKKAAAAAQEQALALLAEALDTAKRARDLLKAVKRARRLDEIKKALQALIERQKKIISDTDGVRSGLAESGKWTRFLLLKAAAAAAG